MSPELTPDVLKQLENKDVESGLKLVTNGKSFYYERVDKGVDHSEIAEKHGIDAFDGGLLYPINGKIYYRGGAGTLGIEEDNPHRPESERLLKETAEEAGVTLRTKSSLVNLNR